MTNKFTQSGCDLIFEDSYLVQYSRNIPVSVTLSDNVFTSCTSLALNFAPSGLHNTQPARVELAKQTDDSYTGAISKAALLRHGMADVALAGTSGDTTIVTRAARVQVAVSVDPDAVGLSDPASLAQVVLAAMQSDEVTTVIRDKLDQIAAEGDLTVPQVLDVLTSTSTTAALSANQGRILAGKIPTIINNLTSTSTTSALSAAQGKALNGSISSLNTTVKNLNVPKVVDVLTSTSTVNALSAYRGKVLYDLLQKIKIIAGTTTCAYNTTTTGVTTAIEFSDYGDVTFSTAPTVVLSPVFSTASAVGYIPADSVTTTGFNVYLRHPSASGSAKVQWIAVSMG